MGVSTSFLSASSAMVGGLHRESSALLRECFPRPGHPVQVVFREDPECGFTVDDVVTSSALWPNDLTFSVTRFRSLMGTPEQATPAEPDSALVVSVMLLPMQKGDCRYWAGGKEMDVPFLPKYCVCINDLEENPATTISAAVDALNFYVPRASLEEIGRDLGVRPLGKFNTVFYGIDPFMTQLAKVVVPYLTQGAKPELLTLDYLALLLGAHLLQSYGKYSTVQVRHKGGLSAFQKRRAAEILRENLAGRITVHDIAAECGLSVSHFARAFRVTFGASVHRWLILQRLALAKELLLATGLPLADIALRSGFADQSAFTRAFQANVSITPGKWRRGNS